MTIHQIFVAIGYKKMYCSIIFIMKIIDIICLCQLVLFHKDWQCNFISVASYFVVPNAIIFSVDNKSTIMILVGTFT